MIDCRREEDVKYYKKNKSVWGVSVVRTRVMPEERDREEQYVCDRKLSEETVLSCLGSCTCYKDIVHSIECVHQNLPVVL